MALVVIIQVNIMQGIFGNWIHFFDFFLFTFYPKKSVENLRHFFVAAIPNPKKIHPPVILKMKVSGVFIPYRTLYLLLLSGAAPEITTSEKTVQKS